MVSFHSRIVSRMLVQGGRRLQVLTDSQYQVLIYYRSRDPRTPANIPSLSGSANDVILAPAYELIHLPSIANAVGLVKGSGIPRYIKSSGIPWYIKSSGTPRYTNE